MKPVLILQNCEGETAGTIPGFLDENSIEFRTLKTFAAETLPELTDIGPIISLGCPVSLVDYRQHDYLRSLYSFVSKAVRTNHPYLGICFGGQLLAHILGANVGPSDNKEIGLYKVRLTESGKNDPLFENFPSDFPVFHWHADRFRIPFGSDLLVEGDDCKYQAFRRGCLAGVQFHLEPTAPEVSHWCDLYAEELAEIGKEKSVVVAEVEEAAREIKKLNDLLLDNFLKLPKESARP
ncbi:MAG: type 1 glutamine amidotransferase [bacterium]|nr:type 1 glutamine amidotransferase [bacterium]